MAKHVFILRIREQYFLFRFVSGLCYIGGAVAGFFSGTAAEIIQGCLFIIALLIAHVLHISPKEKADEMAEQNIAKAKAISADIIEPLLCFGTLALFLLFKRQTDWASLAIWCPVIFIGVMNLIQAIAFKRLEDN